MTRAVFAALFFLSGACGLVYQVVWMRRLSLFFGSDVFSSSITLAAFMGGLALGGYAASRLVDRLRRPLAWYAALELLIGVYALYYPRVLGAFDPVIGGVYGRWAADAGLVYHLVRTTIAFATLLVPTALMGATLPLMLKAFTSRAHAFGETAGWFYAVNTFGALTGVVASTFVLIPFFGLTTATGVAAVVNIAIAAASVAFSRPAETRSSTQEPAGRPATAPERTARLRRMAVIAIAVSGFGSLALEVLWTRILIQSFSATVYSFSLMLVNVLLGIAVGSVVIRRRLGSAQRTASLLADLQMAIAIGVAIPACFTIFIPALYGAFVWGFTAVNAALFGFGSILGILVVSTLFMFPSSALLGAAFPAALEIAHQDAASTGQTVGTIAFANALGCVAGSLAAAFVLIPLLGSQASLLLLAGLFFANGWFVRRTLQQPVMPRFRVPAAVLAGCIGIGLLVPNQTVLNYDMQRGTTPRLVFHAEGMSAVVDVLKTQSGATVLSIDGNIEADTSLPQRRHFVLKAHLPLFALPEGKKEVLVVGLGLGITVSSLLKHDDVAEIDVVELLPGVVQAQAHLRDVNGGVLSDPRLKLRIDDGRNYLRFSGRQYDLITADPIHPRISGVGVLYTREYYALIKEHLKPDGVVLQWMPIYSVSPASFDVAVRTMVEVFPDTSVWHVPGHVMFLARRSGRAAIDPVSLSERLKEPAIASDLESIGVRGTDSFLSLEVLTPADLRRFLSRTGAATAVNTEDLPYLEYRTPFEYLATPAENLATMLRFASNPNAGRFGQ